MQAKGVLSEIISEDKDAYPTKVRGIILYYLLYFKLQVLRIPDEC